jgi:putative colanic acid biosynthesis UDP-glucose lipid carrier transferase
MNDVRGGLMRLVRRVLESASILVAYTAAVWIRYPNLRSENPEYYDYYLQLGVFVVLFWWILDLVFGAGYMQVKKVPADFLRRWGIHIGGMALLLFSLQGYYYSRLFIVLFYALLLVLGGFSVVLYAYLLRKWQEKQRWQIRTLVLFEGAEPPFCPDSHSVIGQFKPHDTRAEELLKSEKIDEVRLQSSDPEEVKRWFALADRHTASFVLCPELHPSTARIPTLYYEGTELRARFRREPLRYWHNRALKRVFDLVLSFGLILLSFWWVLPLVWIGQRFSGGGPMIFKQSRPGRGEQAFTIYKFRSMRSSSEAAIREALPGDERVTRFGRWLRSVHLDEWPQLFNVLNGDMSLVGPRPHLWVQNDKYREIISDFMFRQTLRPGITGLAQVNGLHGDVSSDETIRGRVAYDVEYVENWSLGWDIEILFRTLFL